MTSRLPASGTSINAAQARAARGLLGWTQRRLAAEAGLEPEAVRLFETNIGDLSDQEMQRLGAAISRAGVVLIPAASAGEGVRFRQASGPTTGRGSQASFDQALPAWLPVGER